MKKVVLSVFAVPFILAPAVMLAQSGMKPTAATYITDEEVKTVNALPGVDRQIKVVDIGNENFAVGIVHRGPTGGTPGGISHDQQTEGYLIVSGGGTMVTGGHIVNGRKSGPTNEVTTTLNGPSCSGAIAGADVVRKVVKTGDIVIIPAGVPHGWAEITDHVDYLSFRPSARVLEAGYVNPALKK